MEQFRQKSGKYIILAFLGALIGGSVFYFGYYFGKSQPSFPVLSSSQISTSSAVYQNQNGILDADFLLFWDAVKLIKDKYVRINEVKDEDILYGAIKGAIASLDDPHSVFFPPEDAKKFEEDLQGSFGGIGAEIGIREGQLLIISPLKGNPAEKAGLKAGDKIIKVNDDLTLGLSVDEAVRLIRGEPGTEVKLLIMRDNWTEPKEFAVIRDIIVVPTLDWKIIKAGENSDAKIAYVQLYNFNANASSAFYNSVASALLQGVQGMVLDLRNNSGGYLDVAVDIAGWFLKRGETVTQEKFRTPPVKNLKASGNGALRFLPVAVLVNEGSASASEILAGALRDNRRVMLIGAKTFGKGSVQELERLKNGSTVKISIAEWLTPAGNSIERKGLQPDIEIPAEKENGQVKEIKIGSENDRYLQKALEILNAEILKNKEKTRG